MFSLHEVPMRILSHSKSIRAFGLLLVSATLAGCGGSAPKVAGNAAENEQVIFTSAADCAASGMLISRNRRSTDL
jgi:hypothetical protein